MIRFILVYQGSLKIFIYLIPNLKNNFVQEKLTRLFLFLSIGTHIPRYKSTYRDGIIFIH